jgi:hypothetical protein
LGNGTMKREINDTTFTFSVYRYSLMLRHVKCASQKIMIPTKTKTKNLFFREVSGWCIDLLNVPRYRKKVRVCYIVSATNNVYFTFVNNVDKCLNRREQYGNCSQRLNSTYTRPHIFSPPSRSGDDLKSLDSYSAGELYADCNSEDFKYSRQVLKHIHVYLCNRSSV